MANWQLLPFYGNWLVYFPLSLDKTYDIFLAAQKVTQPVKSVDHNTGHSFLGVMNKAPPRHNTGPSLIAILNKAPLKIIKEYQKFALKFP